MMKRRNLLVAISMTIVAPIAECSSTMRLISELKRLPPSSTGTIGGVPIPRNSAMTLAVEKQQRCEHGIANLLRTPDDELPPIQLEQKQKLLSYSKRALAGEYGVPYAVRFTILQMVKEKQIGGVPQNESFKKEIFGRLQESLGKRYRTNNGRLKKKTREELVGKTLKKRRPRSGEITKNMKIMTKEWFRKLERQALSLSPLSAPREAVPRQGNVVQETEPLILQPIQTVSDGPEPGQQRAAYSIESVLSCLERWGCCCCGRKSRVE